MKLASCQLYRSSLQCKKPFVIATDVCDDCHGLILKLTADSGAVGWGEAVPDRRLTGETIDGVVQVLREHLVPPLFERDLWQLESLHREVFATVRSSSAVAAVDIAVHDLLSRASGVSLCQFLGGPARPVRTNYSIGITTSQAAADEAQELVRHGYNAIKLKVGDDPHEDVARVRAVRRAIGPQVRLRIDANEGRTVPAALRALKAMEELDIELVEQPVAKENLDGFVYLRNQQSIPVAADESVHTPEDALRLLRAGAVDILNIKLMKSGGLLPARRIQSIARAFGAQLMVGGMVGESRLAVSAATALASAWGFEYADLDADLLVVDPLSDEGARVDGEWRVPSQAPGLGLDSLSNEALTLIWEQ
ncbi:MAG: dipeptide epimerase [Candidatus Eremiobacteraeota bacterium]|nr:dipeptide epimerase [Candidatus Eremiobacteraeota bacterium]